MKVKNRQYEIADIIHEMDSTTQKVLIALPDLASLENLQC